MGKPKFPIRLIQSAGSIKTPPLIYKEEIKSGITTYSTGKGFISLLLLNSLFADCIIKRDTPKKTCHETAVYDANGNVL